MIEKLKVVSLIDYSFRPSGKFYGYKYYVGFESLQGNIHEYLTNNKKLFESLGEGRVYEVEYTPILDKCIAPSSACIMVDMKKLKIRVAIQ